MIDVIEIDAASYNGVENIREIIEHAKFTPTQGKYKIYIIDEVHMLSKGAFNALLKTLEEPPKHVIFLLATTEINKVPDTILSRVIRFDLERINDADMG
jgi:DNA polymerase-3 subunit gamma/tau